MPVVPQSTIAELPTLPFSADSPGSIRVSAGVHGVKFFILPACCGGQTRGMQEFDHRPHFPCSPSPVANRSQEPSLKPLANPSDGRVPWGGVALTLLALGVGGQLLPSVVAALLQLFPLHLLMQRVLHFLLGIWGRCMKLALQYSNIASPRPRPGPFLHSKVTAAFLAGL